ncbi:MAG: restriction endonuclease subunit S [Desulfuromonadaceae bacterium]|nr:restriction endonuclease subunit S [Desulfuromonadaceae bacterium]
MIPKGWKKEEISNLCEYAIDCVNKTAPTVETETPYLMLRTSNIRGGRISLNGTKCVTEEVYLNWTRRLVPQKGDVILTREAPVGEVGMIEGDEKIFLGQRLFHYRVNKTVLSPEYLLHSLLSPIIQRHINEMSFGATVEHMKVEDALKIPIVLPSLPEQTAIASLLSTWDLSIEKTERLIVAKEKRFTSLVMSMIAEKCDRWAHLRADKIFKNISEKQNDHEELLSVTQDRGVIPRTMLEGRVMSPESGTDTYKLIKVGDFAISLRSFQGGIEYSRYQGLISPAYTVLRSKLEIDVDFYRHFFKSYLFIEKYLSIAVIGIRDGKQISIPDFMSVKIPLPPIEEQKQIAAILTTARQEIDLLKKQANAYRRQKRGLMQRLLTGEWRVRVR